MEPRKTRVAILGGGAGALAAAWALSETPELRARFDVTVHQLGFRLGGKGATGRNPAASQRIEAAGSHVLLGAYDHTFRLMRACYDELDRPAGAKIRAWSDAIRSQGHAVVMCRLSGDSAHDGGWFPWTFRFPVNAAVPGDPGSSGATPWELLRVGVEWLWSLWSRAAEVKDLLAFAPRAADAAAAAADMPPWIAEALAAIESSAGFAPLEHPLAGTAFPAHDAPAGQTDAGLGRIVSAIRNVVRSMPASPSDHPASAHHMLVWLLRRLRDRAWELLSSFVPTEPWAYKLWTSIDLAAAMAVGVLSDGLLFHGHETIDHLDFRQWLRQSGANDATLESGPLQAIYDAAFAYVNGDPEKGNLAAGTCLHALLRALLTYRGAALWHLEAGPGDTLFAPLHEALARRGVKFQFFHRVTGISLSPDQKSVAAIEILQQVKLRGGYDPLVDVGGLPCWPNAPLHDQIADGAERALSGIDLESPYSVPWKDAKKTTLIAGLDFDQVVLGISLGAIPYVASELILADQGFRGMVANVGTVQTLSFQLWLDRGPAELGWLVPEEGGERSLAVAYVHPTNAWADVSHVIPYEAWSDGAAPKTVACWTGPLEQLGPASPFSDLGFVAKQRARVQSLARKYLENDVGRLWPLATKSEGHGFRWDLVLSQHHRASVDPSDRHVLSVAGSTRFRLPPGRSGFSNLVLAGDWVRTSWNAGCIEAAIEAGLAAARALEQAGT